MLRTYSPKEGTLAPPFELLDAPDSFVLRMNWGSNPGPSLNNAIKSIGAAALWFCSYVCVLSYSRTDSTRSPI